MMFPVPAGANAWRSTFETHPARRIAVFLEDRAQFAAVLWAAWATGKQVVLPGDVLPSTVTALGAHVDAYVGEFPGLAPLTPGGERAFEWKPFDREAVGVVVFTSGSTGVPVAIPKKLRQLFDEVETLEATFGARLGARATFFSTVSHHHIYGLLCAVLWPLMSGRALSAQRIEYPEQLELVLANEASVLVASPAHLKRLPEGARWKTQLKAVFSSGGPLPLEGALRSAQMLGHQPIELYGSSETGGIAWRQGTELGWQPMSGVEAAVSEDGTLRVRSRHLPDGEWFTTADRVELQAGTFQLRGRADRLAKIEEKRVSLELIERTARETGLLSEVRVVTLSGARVSLGLAGVPTGEGLALPRKALIDRLRAALERTVERVAVPRRFRFVDVLPTNAQGKITEAVVSKLFAAERPSPEWIERGPTRAVIEVTIPGDLRVLDGHFQQAAVVPGVAQIDWAIAWAREAFGCSGGLERMEAIKFQRIMMPGHRPTVALDWNAERRTITFRFSTEKGSYSSGRVVLRA